jgi:hypothetical protein
MPGDVTLRSLIWLVACVGLVGGRRGLNPANPVLMARHAFHDGVSWLRQA